MAQWVQRSRVDGTAVVQIRWRKNGRQHSETFTNIRLAIEFRTAVESSDHVIEQATTPPPPARRTAAPGDPSTRASARRSALER
jgi:hypothetical protein